MNKICCVVNPLHVCLQCPKCPSFNKKVCSYHLNLNKKCRYCGKYTYLIHNTKPDFTTNKYYFACKKYDCSKCKTWQRLKNGGHISILDSLNHSVWKPISAVS